ncbi:PREDICTED: ZP domain-containing protein-like isoform X2 [Acropora digitifera]|uniref:ZP domain-containing protein-like isoform X2 n=1 Tax=Acropora digitifera TaxID=70779 RepID=UPI00077A38FC|nr:PREDICTED: ZP domain-containing protein-like isoform X2 [Acropora digitifera]
MSANKFLDRKRCIGWILIAVVSIVTAAKSGNDYAGIHTKCTPHYMQLTLEKQHYDKIDPSSLHLTDDRCKINFDNSTVMIIRAPLGGCGTTIGKWRSFLDFRNKVFADITGRSSIAREPAYEFRLRCLYFTTAKLSLHSFKPETKIIVEPPTRYGTFVFETNMFQTDKFISEYTDFPVKVHIGQSIFLQVRMVSNVTGLSLLLDNCRATPTSDPNDTEFHTLIKDGCPVDKHLSYKTSDSMYQRFSFTAFQIENAQVMYLHCEVLVCSKNSNSSRCAQGCLQNPGGSTRRKRDETNEFFKTGVTSLGPVRVLLDRVQVSPPEVAQTGGSHSSLVILQNSAAVMTFLLACLLVM